MPAAFMPQQGQAFDHRAIARLALERHIVPGYRRFADAARALGETTGALCAAPSGQTFARVRDAFRETVAAWGRIEHINVGPVTQGQRRERLIFWPDRRGLGRKQVEKILADPEPSGLSRQAFASKSVAVQGLTAFDAVAFGPAATGLSEPPSGDAKRCAYANAIASNVAGIAGDIVSGWSDENGFRKTWLEPGPDNPAFIEEKETTRALVRAYLDGLEQARDLRLAGPLGFRDQKLKALDPPLSNSGLALTLIAANVAGARAFLEQCGFLDPALVAAPARDGEETAGVLRAIAGELDLATASIRKAEATPRPFSDAQAKQRLSQAGFPLRNAKQTGGAYLSEAADLGVGFNASDGD